jgi:hypothetical protein
MRDLKFEFLESPEAGIAPCDVVLPHLSGLDKDEITRLKKGFRGCDAVCDPPGYDHPVPCDCKSNLAAV